MTDNGVGIDAKNAGSLFMPFLTTKSNGMGVELSICRSIVEAHGGQISAVPAPQVGASFSVRWPTQDEARA